MVIEINQDNFRQEILERSLQETVVVDFWSPRQPATEQMGPSLELLSQEMGFTLCRVNVDNEREMVMAMRITSVPDVRVVDQGRVVDGFQGFRTQGEIREFLNPFFQDPLVAALEQAQSLRLEGQGAQALEILNQILQHDPKHKKAQLEQARCLLDLGQSEEAKGLLQTFQSLDEGYSQAQSLLKLMSFAEELSKPVEDHPCANPYLQGIRASLEENWELAFDSFLEVAKSDRAYRQDGGRLAMITLFQVLAQTHVDLVKRYRQRLSMYLFS